MIEGMGIQWAGTLLGCVGFVLVPMPVVFWKYGARIRERSTFAPAMPLAGQASAPPRVEDEEEKVREQ